MTTTAHLERLNAPQRKAVTQGEPLPDKGYRSGPHADRGRRRHRQDRHAGASRRAPGDQRRGSGAHPDADLHAARGYRDAPARARHHQEGARRRARRHRRGHRAAPHLERAPSIRSATGCCATTRRTCSSTRISASWIAPTRPTSWTACARSWDLPARNSAFRARKPACRSTPTASTRARRSRRLSRSSYPWCAQWEADLTRLYRAYVEQKQHASLLDYDDLLLYWHGMMTRAAPGAAHRRAFRSRAGRRISGHQPPAGRDPARAQARRRGAGGGGRRRAGDLLVPCRGGGEHPRLPRALRPARPKW